MWEELQLSVVLKKCASRDTRRMEAIDSMADVSGSAGSRLQSNLICKRNRRVLVLLRAYFLVTGIRRQLRWLCVRK